MDTWLPLDGDHPFGVQTLAYGVFSTRGSTGASTPNSTRGSTRDSTTNSTHGSAGPRVGVRIGDQVLDAGAAAERAGMESGECWTRPSLNAFLAKGPQAWAGARAWLTTVLTDESYRDAVEPFLHDLAEPGLTLHLPVEIADYVDFYASEHHAARVGALFRPDRPAIPDAWHHLPIGYHGRAGTVVVSGTDVRRPDGQRRGTDGPTFGPTRRLDFEAELGFVVGGATTPGHPVTVDQAPEHLFGVVLLNDWSARDVQAWEYVPLGPFLGKSFATSVSAWVTPMAAFDQARVPLPGQDPEPLPYLRGPTAAGIDVHLEVCVNGTTVSRPEYRDMYWSPEQLLAHLTVNGATLRDGDLLGSGTVSGAEDGSQGCLLELSSGGQHPLELDDGTTRTFLEDGDLVAIRAWAPGPDGTRVGVGEVSGRIRPALGPSTEG